MTGPQDDLEAGVIKYIQSNYSESSKQFKKGRLLLWQGDRVNCVFAIREGAVKISSISYDGKIYTYGIVGAGGLIGAPEILTGENARVMVEAITDTDTIVIPYEDFQDLFFSHPQFAVMVAKKMAKHLIYMSDKAKGQGSFDVQQRLKDALNYLAIDYGIKTKSGIRIKLDITHKDIAELIGANRTTITYFMNEFKRQGYLSKEGKHLVLRSFNDMIPFGDKDYALTN